jgi:hypothetical protein
MKYSHNHYHYQLNYSYIYKNNRSFGDLTGKFTSHSTLGSSVIDYFVTSEAILGKLLFMKVHDLSDHCLISCVLSVNFTFREVLAADRIISLKSLTV